MIRKRRAFATMAALIVLGLLTVALTTMAAATSADHRRLAMQQQQARASQLLLAGMIDATSRIRAAKPETVLQSWVVESPQQIGSVHVTIIEENAAAVRVQLWTDDSQHLEQTLEIDRNADGRIRVVGTQ